MRKHSLKVALLTVGLGAVYMPAFAGDHPIAKPKVYQNKVEAALVWIEPVKMKPVPTMDMSKKFDIHNEVDMHQIKGSDMGFGAGGWIPNASVACTISKQKSDWRIVFSMMSMVASDGPHYGRNISLDGPGVYDQTCHIDPPDWNGFWRHVDPESGVGPFFTPFDITGSFTFVGSGKAGGY